jgi:phage tail protein X
MLLPPCLATASAIADPICRRHYERVTDIAEAKADENRHGVA